ncbi:MAG: hydrogenase maturation protease [Chloroflexia bacterium]|nr:hydrogenase maturation protease [Chloroflexia bacterium]
MPAASTTDLKLTTTPQGQSPGTLNPLRVMIAGVGYPFLRDLSIGPVLVPELQRLEWPAGVEVDDWSFGPIAVVQRLEDRPGFYDRIVFLAAVERGRRPGAVVSSRWDGRLPDPEEIQQRVGEAVMGVISLDNLLIICQHFGALPADVRLVEVEPEAIDSGADFTPTVEAALAEVVAAVRRAALEGRDG